MNKKLLLVGLVVFLIIMAVVIAGLLISSLSKIGGTKSFSQSEARAVAEANLDFFETWRGANISGTDNFYDLGGNPSAYYFEVSDYYGKAGYMIISATDKEEPVISISKSTDSPPALAVKLVYKLVEGTIHAPADVRTEMIYLGGKNKFIAKLTFIEGTDIEEKYYDLNLSESLTAEEIAPLTKEELDKLNAYYQDTKEKDADKGWQLLGK